MAAPLTGRTGKQRPEDRLGHRTKAEQAKVARLPVPEDAPPVVIPEANPNWGTGTMQIWQSILVSPVSEAYYQDSDYATAWYFCELVEDSLSRGIKTKGQLETLRKFMQDLLLTESARRAADILIDRSPVEQDDARVLAMQAARDRRA